MSPTVYRITTLLTQLLAQVPLGTNLGLLHLLLTLLCGRFLSARGAVFPALADAGLTPDAVRRAAAALAYGRWHTQDLLAHWNQTVQQEGHWRAHRYEGIRPVALDFIGFFRTRLQDCHSKHYLSEAGKALPAVVLAVLAGVGSVGRQRLALPRHLWRQEEEDASEADLRRRVLSECGALLTPEEALICDAGFPLAELLEHIARFVVRMRSNATARRNHLPAYSGQGRRPEYGEGVRFLPGQRAGKELPATAPKKRMHWCEAGRTLRASVWNDLVLPDQKPGATPFRVIAIFDPRYSEPLLLATTLPVSAYAVWRLYRDRWPIEQMPLAAKQMLGAERAFVHGSQSRYRLPELALLAGNVLSYVAATSQPVASGFWDRAARPTCGRLRRALSRLDFSELACLGGELRKKASVTTHLPKGVKGHRRQKASQKAPPQAQAA